ncbi:hypothetical protein A2U01_0103069, partial [Trifolium medium]|nr:hypothetical protein [Trifolium medium]
MPINFPLPLQILSPTHPPPPAAAAPPPRPPRHR